MSVLDKDNNRYGAGCNLDENPALTLSIKFLEMIPKVQKPN
jgi:hypothetical protein